MQVTKSQAKQLEADLNHLVRDLPITCRVKPQEGYYLVSWRCGFLVIREQPSAQNITEGYALNITRCILDSLVSQTAEFSYLFKAKWWQVINLAESQGPYMTVKYLRFYNYNLFKWAIKCK